MIEATKKSGRRSGRFLSVVDLFSGCGGLGLGLEYAGFKTVFVNELNVDAMQSYLINRHHSLGGVRFSENEALRCSDIHELDEHNLTRLKTDLAGIPEIAFKMERRIPFGAGAGSNLDLLVGGPPCQGFSGIGLRRSYSVDKADVPANQLYKEMIRIIRSLRPRIFMFENVKGILTSKWHANGVRRVWDDVFGGFRNIEGYEVRWHLVHARDYGVPQNRPRVLLVGIRKDILASCPVVDASVDEQDAILCGFLPPPQKDKYPNIDELLGDLLDHKIERVLRSGNFPPGTFSTNHYPRDPKTDIQKKMRHVPSHQKEITLTEHEYSRHSRRVVERFSYMLENNGEIPEKLKTKKFAQRVIPAKWGPLGPTITAASLPDDYVHFSQPRSLTVREWARIQLFPDWYVFCGKRTTGGLRRAGNPRMGIFERELPKYTQIGNAVPVGLAHAVGRHFASILQNL